MGVIICSKHGESGFTQRISRSICDLIDSDTPISDENLSIVSLNMYDDGEFLGTNSYLISRDELDQAGVSEQNDVTTEEQYDAILDKLPEMSGVCYDCLEEYKVRHHIELLSFK